MVVNAGIILLVDVIMYLLLNISVITYLFYWDYCEDQIRWSKQ